MLLTSRIFVEFVEELYTLHGERPPAILNFQARASQLRCNLSNNSGRRAIIDICTVVFGSIACPRVVTLTALQTAGAFVYTHDYRTVRTVQAAQPL